MAWLVLGNRRINGSRSAAVSVLRRPCRVFRAPVIRVDDVACRATTVAIVAWLIVGAGERQHRIEQARLLQAEEDRIGAQGSAETSIAQFRVGTSGIFIFLDDSNT